jgi:hypothetical protein
VTDIEALVVDMRRLLLRWAAAIQRRGYCPVCHAVLATGDHEPRCDLMDALRAGDEFKLENTEE